MGRTPKSQVIEKEREWKKQWRGGSTNCLFQTTEHLTTANSSQASSVPSHCITSFASCSSLHSYSSSASINEMADIWVLNVQANTNCTETKSQKSQRSCPSLSGLLERNTEKAWKADSDSMGDQHILRQRSLSFKCNHRKTKYNCLSKADRCNQEWFSFNRSNGLTFPAGWMNQR